MSDEVVYHLTPTFEEHGVNKCEEAVISHEFEEKVEVSEPELKSEEKKEDLLDKLHRSDSSSSSSSEMECEDGDKKKKKKSLKLKEKIKEKMNECKDKKEDEKIEKHEADTYVPVEKYEEAAVPRSSFKVGHTTPTSAQEEKKGFMEKIKEKLPGGHKKTDEEHASPPPATLGEEGEHKEKKGIFKKINEKIPGYHSKSEEEKEKVKGCD